MKTQRIAIALTAINLVLLAFILIRLGWGQSSHFNMKHCAGFQRTWPASLGGFEDLELIELAGLAGGRGEGDVAVHGLEGFDRGPGG